MAHSNHRRTHPRITILGTGQMGIVCALLLSGQTAPVLPGPSLPRSAVALDIVLWGHSADESDGLLQTRRSPRLPGVLLPEHIRVTHDLPRALDGAELVVSAIPVQFIRDVWKRARGRMPATCEILSVAKGIENTSLLRPTQIIADALGDNLDAPPRKLGVLSGPTIATELARGLPATMIAAADDADFARRVQQRFSTSFLRIYTSDDVKGVELAGAMKNVIAIAAGILDGLQAGNNAKSALLARGLAEITRLGTAMGASQDTFFGIAGVGDLATSCFSPEGRNRSCGEALGRGRPLADFLKSTSSVVEGVATTRSVMELAARYRVEMPITQAVHAVLFEGVDPIEGISRLMSREPKAERVG
jgi:glycerol-3-phosphate dehydrogenase (NAD(P)+)